MGHDNTTGRSNKHGHLLLKALKKINNELDAVHNAEKQKKYVDDTKKTFFVLITQDYGGKEQITCHMVNKQKYMWQICNRTLR